MILVDTSVWIEIFRDKTGDVVSKFRQITKPYPAELFHRADLRTEDEKMGR